ncbi:MAG: carboxypeptidase regulatory-like domain-containing protein [Vulcanimicrobiaceae bacterium]
MHHSKVSRGILAVVMLLAFLAQGTWALAGTTGGISGNLLDERGAAVANANVTATSPSGTVSTTTDASGHFVFLTLEPDTYTISALKSGFDPISTAGVSVFADQVQTISLHTRHSLKEIANVTSRAAGDLVKSGQTSDVYSVNANVNNKVESINGGNYLNTAFGALQSVPGVVVAGSGVVYIRGADYQQIGYEFDGVPVNRAFDTYSGTNSSDLGQQELQVYAGGGPSGASAQTTAGFINQVIRTGTYPGFGSVDAYVEAPSYYHGLRIEAGGANPSRTFSYYFATAGYNQAPRYLSQFDGQGLPGFLPGYSYATDGRNFGQGPVAACGADGSDPLSGTNAPPGGDPGCLRFGVPMAINQNGLNRDRESVLNLHFALPHKNDGGRDDVQLLYSVGSDLYQNRNSINDIGGLGNLQYLYDDPTLQPTWKDGAVFGPSVKFGQVVTPGNVPQAVPYYFPSSPTNRCANGFGSCQSLIPDDFRDGTWHDFGIVKAQYTKNLNSHSYARVFGYTYYSDWLSTGALSAQFGNFLNGQSGDYELSTHTRGAEFQYANQLTSKHLLTATANYTTATTVRFNNSTFNSSLGSAATNLVSFDSSGNPTCYAYQTFSDGTGFTYNPGDPAPCDASKARGSFGNPIPAAYSAAALAGTPAARNNAQWIVTNLGPQGTLNRVQPTFTSYSLNDQYRPTDKLVINAGVRFERQQYTLPPSDTPDYAFWFNAGRNEFCYDPVSGAPIRNPLTPTQVPPATLFIGLNCPNGSVHPDGQNGHLLLSSATTGQLVNSTFEPRFGMTYTFNPDTVGRVNVGLFSQPVQTALVEYLNAAAGGGSNAANQFNFRNFFGLGFSTPQHDLPPARSVNLDASYERHFKGTDWSMKVTPYYRRTRNQFISITLAPGFASGFPAGTQTAYGAEFSLQKGDPNRNGLSGQLSYTYTHSYMHFEGNGLNVISGINQYIDSYNGLTSTGNREGQKGAMCYHNLDASQNFAPGTVAPAADCSVQNGQVVMTAAGLAAGDVINPYYLKAAQGLLNPNDRFEMADAYPTGVQDAGSTIVYPHEFSGYINYKHNKLTITPNFILLAGNAYGSPTDIDGVDPRACSANQSNVATAPNPGLPNYLSCNYSPFVNGGVLAVPNPDTGQFDGWAKYRNPWMLNIGMQASYQVTPRVTLNLMLLNVVNRCFGGSKGSWTKQYAPGTVVCGYQTNGSYVSNFYNGSSPNDTAANGVAAYQQFLPMFSPYSGAQPFNVIMSANIRL